MSFFKTALSQIHDSEKERIKNISVALRVAKFADDDEFSRFIDNKKEEKADGLINF